MQNSTWSNALLAALASLALVCTPIPALAQHGGGHGGGGGGFHGGGFSGGGFHGGSGGFHGGGFSGAHAGSFGYGSRGVSGSQGARGFEGGRGSYGMRSGSSSMGRSSRPWASEGQGVRNTSPGWHGFEDPPAAADKERVAVQGCLWLEWAGPAARQWPEEAHQHFIPL